MRISIVFLTGLLVFSQAFSADNLIRLSKPLSLELPAAEGTVKPASTEAEKGATAAGEKEAVKSDNLDKSAKSEKSEKSDKQAASAASDVTPSGKKIASTIIDDSTMSPEEQSQRRLAENIKKRLEALRDKERLNGAPRTQAIPYVNRSPYAKGKRKEQHEEVHAAHLHWSYEGEEGPTNWGKLNPEWATCDKGNRQSPIDIQEGIKVDIDPVKFQYKPTRFKVTDNGHTIQVDLEPESGNFITQTGRRYELIQFHFHRPSEERVNGKSFEMVVHLVHKSEDGKLAVVALLVEQGLENPMIQNVWNNLPLERNVGVPATGLMDVTQLLPMASDYYTYMGSLTTPPCSEGVLWLVMKQPILLSPLQIAIFTRLYPMNARPIQPSASRLIKESD